MTTQNNVAQARRDGVLFGVPLGDLGWFQSLLMGLATGFVAFFLSTFLAIVGLLAYLMTTGKTPDFALTYRVVGLPIGLVAGALALGYLGVQYAKKLARKSHRA